MQCVSHDWFRINPGIGNSTGKNRDDRGRVRIENCGHGLYLSPSQDSRDVESNALVRQVLYKRNSRVSPRICDWYLDIDVALPAADFASLKPHLSKLIGANFK